MKALQSRRLTRCIQYNHSLDRLIHCECGWGGERRIVKEGDSSRHTPQIDHFRWGPSNCVQGNRDFDLVQRSCVLLSWLPWLARLLIPLTGNYSRRAVQRGAHLQPWSNVSWLLGQVFRAPREEWQVRKDFRSYPLHEQKKRLSWKGRKVNTRESDKRRKREEELLEKWRGIWRRRIRKGENDNEP